jgi:hypothetical protein
MFAKTKKKVEFRRRPIYLFELRGTCWHFKMKFLDVFTNTCTDFQGQALSIEQNHDGVIG